MSLCVISFTGEALLESNSVVDFVYCSPSLRCVQTAHNILRGKIKSFVFCFFVNWFLLFFFSHAHSHP